MRSRGAVVTVWVAVAVGVVAAFVADLSLWMNDDSCPQWEDEGTMAAPHSPYALVMCAPSQPPLVWAWLLGIALSVLVAVWTLRHRGDRTTRVLPVALVLLVAPTLLIGLLHVSLPQDCLTGATRTGDCTRDRELR